jgi:dipeptidyl aminopeptidase/acylaminoacyl peptidase
LNHTSPDRQPAARDLAPGQRTARLTLRQRLPRLLGLVASSLVLIYVLVCAYAAALYTTPTRGAVVLPEARGLTYRPVEFPAAEDNLRLRGWLIAAPGSDRLIISVHGKDDNRGSAGSGLAEIHRRLVGAGFNVLAFDLRGHGTSDGDRYSLGYYEQRDILGAITFAEREGFAGDHIGLLGFSMGAATTLLVLPRSDVKAAVADSAFADLHLLLTTAFPLPKIFLPGVILAARLEFGVDVDQVSPMTAIQHLGQRRVLLIHGEDDSLIPVSHLDLLAQAGGGNVVAAWRVPGAAHIGGFTSRPEEYMSKVIGFFEQELGST